jgi:hypothetical protein
MKNEFNIESEMRNAEAPSPESINELVEYINSLTECKLDYGTCVYAMSLATAATFNYMCNKLGVTGFQADYASLDTLRRTGHYKHGFHISNYENLLYPQYLDREHFPTHQELLMKNKEYLSKVAKEKLRNSEDMAPRVRRRMEYVASLD